MKPTASMKFVVSASALVFGALTAAPAFAQQQPPGAPPVAPAAAGVAPSPATAPTAPAAPAAPAVEEPAVADEPVDGTLVRMGRSEVVIHAPMEAVVRAMTDYTRYSEFMPRVRESRVVRRNRAMTDVYMQVPLGGSLGVIWALLRLDTRRTADRFQIDGLAVDSNMDRFETHTLIERVPGAEPRTRVTFRVLALPRLPFPSSVFTREMRDAARTVASNLRARVERAQALTAVAPAAPPAAAVPPNATSQR